MKSDLKELNLLLKIRAEICMKLIAFYFILYRTNHSL